MIRLHLSPSLVPPFLDDGADVLFAICIGSAAAVELKEIRRYALMLITS